jgi:hypothetical protein
VSGISLTLNQTPDLPRETFIKLLSSMNNPFPLSGSLLDDSEQQYLNDFLDGLITAPPTIPQPTPPISPSSETNKHPIEVDRKGPGRPKKRKKVEVEDDKQPKRELLTENEKRLNHVVSEQRRRALIKDGFTTLVELTPELQQSPVNTGPGNTGGSHSKSTILFKAADYIKELKQQIEGLQAQLRTEREKFKYPQPSFVNVQPSFLAPAYYNVYSTESSTVPSSTTA